MARGFLLLSEYQPTKNPRAAPEGDGLVNIPIAVKKKLLALQN